MSLNGLGVLNYENSKVSGERHLIYNILPAHIQHKKPLFLDIGANIGEYSVSLRDAFPNAEIHAFEPHPITYYKLEYNVAQKKIKPVQLGVGEITAQLNLYDRADLNGSSHASLYSSVISEIHKQKVVSHNVSVVTLDHYAKTNMIDYIDFIKIDTEGNELAVLRGGKALLENMKVGCIHFEFNEMNIISRTYFRDLRNILRNYNLFRLLPKGLILLNDERPLMTELYAYQNIIALPKKNKL